jgi:mRNA interferase RelE/StbE
VGLEVKLHRDVEKQLKRIPREDAVRVAGAIRSLGDEPRPHNCEHLIENLFRVRIGGYRIIYAVFDDRLIVFVCKVDRRSEATYRDLDRMLSRARGEVEGS